MIKLWSAFDPNNIAALIAKHNFNFIKIILNPLSVGYSVVITINAKEESMHFSYYNSTIIQALDYGLLPTIIFSAICNAKEEYIYDNKVFVEILDKRINCNMNVKSYSILRLTDNIIGKITGMSARDNDYREEQNILQQRMARINYKGHFTDDYKEDPDSNDFFDFFDSDWFQENVAKYSNTRVLKLKKSIDWSDEKDGYFRCPRNDLEKSFIAIKKTNKLIKKNVVNTNFLKKEYKDNSLMDKENYKVWRRKLNFDVGFDRMDTILLTQKALFDTPIVPVPSYTSCHKECVHKMIISSPLSGSNFRLVIMRCALHNQHWGHLTVDQWEGCSTQPIYFPLPGGHQQGRILLEELSNMLRAARVVNTTTSNNTSVTSANTTSTTTTQPSVSQQLSVIKPLFNVATNNTSNNNTTQAQQATQHVTQQTSQITSNISPKITMTNNNPSNNITTTAASNIGNNYNAVSNSGAGIKRIYSAGMQHPQNILPASSLPTTKINSYGNIGAANYYAAMTQDNTNMSLETLMTKSIQTGKLLYDNRDILPSASTNVTNDMRKKPVAIASQIVPGNNSQNTIMPTPMSIGNFPLVNNPNNTVNNNAEMMLMINTNNLSANSQSSISSSPLPSNQSGGITFSKQVTEDSLGNSFKSTNHSNSQNSINKCSYYSIKDLSLDDLF